MILDLTKLRNLNPSKDRVDVACPLCGPQCKTPSNRTRKVLRIWDDGEFVTYKCARCEASGWAKDAHATGHEPRPKPAERADSSDRAELAHFLWGMAVPLSDSLAETYLRSRHCLLASDNLRFLPARGDHAPAMIARFGDSDLTGIHITKLRGDGMGKAGTDKDKIMIGPSVGQPIIVQSNPERDELVIAEGIEDASSLALCTGWTAWAAGSAGRIASVMPAATGFSRVLVAIDRDRAGNQALERAKAARTDVIPLRVWRALPSKAATDANRALIEFGPDALMAAVEWCIAQGDHRAGRVGFETMRREITRAEGIFHGIAGDAMGLK